MINNDYLIEEYDSDDSGGYCDFLRIKNHKDIGFKNFKRKDKAQQALSYQQILSSFDLAPIPITGLCKIPYYFDPKILQHWQPKQTTTGWGFVTESATIVDYDKHRRILLYQIQGLVEEIWAKTKLKFWDCHEHNVGYIKRGRSNLLVCIDTGKESFDSYSNAWGFEEPGPKCPYCLKYQCRCREH